MVLIDVETDSGVTGHAYIFAYTKLTLKALTHLVEEIGRELVGQTGRAVRPDGGDGCKISAARLAGTGRHGGVGPRHGLLGCAGPGRQASRWWNCSAARQNRSRPMTAMAWSIPLPTRRRCAVRSIRAFAASRSRAATAMPPMTSAWSRACASLLGPDIALMIDFNQSLDPAEAKRRIERLAPYDLTWVEEPVPQENLLGHAEVRDNLADTDPGRRELVVSARICRGDRSRRQRFHHARPDEVRRRHRLAARGGPGGSRLDPDVEPSVRGSQRPHAGGDADRALARVPGPCPCGPGEAGRDRGWNGDRAGAGAWDRMERGRDREISGASRR